MRLTHEIHSVSHRTMSRFGVCTVRRDGYGTRSMRSCSGPGSGNDTGDRRGARPAAKKFNQPLRFSATAL